MAYYRCDHCGVSVRHNWSKTSGAVLAQFAGATESSSNGVDPANSAADVAPLEVPKAEKPKGQAAGFFGL
jgi:hypothetical protein